MRKLPILTHLLAVAVLGAVCSQSMAAEYRYRVPAKGIRANNYGPPPPIGGPTSPGGTSGGGGSTAPGGEGSGGGTTTPPAEVTYATSGIQFLRNGAPITELYMEPGDRVQLTLRNSASSPVRGWLGVSSGGWANADMAGSTCSQNSAAGVPTTLQPGAQCQFTLVALIGQRIRPDDNFPFRGLEGNVIPSVLSLPGMSAQQPGSGGGLTPAPEV